MLDKIKALLAELLKPVVQRAIQDERSQTETQLRQLEARIATIEQKPKSRDWAPLVISLVSLGAALLTVCLNTYFTYRIHWNPLFTETHLLNGYVTGVKVTEDHLEAQIVFSNEGTQTEVLWEGRFTYTSTNADAGTQRHSQSTNSISPFI